MELQSLRYFVEVVKQKSFTAAAEKMFVTQPTISKMVKSLEDEIGRCCAKAARWCSPTSANLGDDFLQGRAERFPARVRNAAPR